MRKLIVPPKLTKPKKQKKGVLTPIAWKKSATKVAFGIYGIQVLKSLRISLKQLEIARRQISKYLNKNETFWLRVIPDIPVTKKPTEIRMGKGKGAIQYWALRVKAGQTIFEFSFISPKKAKLIFLNITKRLPVPCNLLYHKTKII